MDWKKIIGVCIRINFRVLECGTNIKLKGERFLAGMLLLHGIGQTGRTPGVSAKIVLGWLQEVAYSHHTKVLAPSWQNSDVLTWLLS